MDKITLELQVRETEGKHNAALRRRGITPAHLFGPGIPSKSLMGQTAAIEQILATAGMSRLVHLKIEGEKRSRSVLVREIQRRPATMQLLHVDLYQVKSTRKMTAEVPVRTVGESPVVESRLGTLVLELPVLSIECLPADLPEYIEVDVSAVETVADVIRVSDVPAPGGVTILNAQDVAVVTVTMDRSAHAEEAAEAAETAEATVVSHEEPEE